MCHEIISDNVWSVSIKPGLKIRILYARVLRLIVRHMVQERRALIIFNFKKQKRRFPIMLDEYKYACIFIGNRYAL